MLVIAFFILLLAISLVTSERSIAPSVFDPPYPKAKHTDSHYTSTGTTIVGICCVDGVVLGADTRATGGVVVVDKTTHKIHRIDEQIFCCAAGTSADCTQLTRHAAKVAALIRVEQEMSGDFNTPVAVSLAVKSMADMIQHPSEFQLYRRPESVLIIGGVDHVHGPTLFELDVEGFPQRVSFTALGSGSIDALSVLETARLQWQQSSVTTVSGSVTSAAASNPTDGFTENVTVEEAIAIVRAAVRAGISNDLGSGSHVDLCVMQPLRPTRLWRELDPSASAVATAVGGRFDGCIVGKDSLADSVGLDTSVLGQKIFSRVEGISTNSNGAAQNALSSNRLSSGRMARLSGGNHCEGSRLAEVHSGELNFNIELLHLD